MYECVSSDVKTFSKNATEVMGETQTGGGMSKRGGKA